MCTVVVVMYRKKKISQPRTVNVVQNPPEVNYRMSDLAAQENSEVPVAATQVAPSQFTPIVLQSNDGHAKHVEAFEDDFKDDIKDVYTFDNDDDDDDDIKPLIS